MVVKDFKKISSNDVKTAGGKGASLGEMLRAGISVPSGFVVLASAFDRFLAETDLTQAVEARLDAVNYGDVNSVDNVSRAIRGLILNVEFPSDLAQVIFQEYKRLKLGRVAVRSSATAEDSKSASWAGELESYLNVEKKNLLESIKKCWASLFTTRAIVYRQEKGLRKTKVSVAVVVQKMVEAEVAGICFTAHPVTKDRAQMVIEAGWGLGEAVVGGRITPDTYVVGKLKAQSTKFKINSKIKIQNSKGGRIIDKNIAEQGMMIVRGGGGTVEKRVAKGKQGKQKISDKQILRLAKIAEKIEAHYGVPQDIEWAVEKGKIHILQARPITTM